MKKHIKTFIALVMCFSLFGCDNRANMEDLRNYVAKLKQKIESRKKNDELAGLKLATPPDMQVKITRSPFADYSGNRAVSSDPLQAYPIAKLRFTGTLVQNNDISGFILTPDNKIYQVKIGDMIGDKYGKIIKILPDRMEVNEEVQSETGDHTTTSLVTLQLKDGN